MDDRAFIRRERRFINDQRRTIRENERLMGRTKSPDVAAGCFLRIENCYRRIAASEQRMRDRLGYLPDSEDDYRPEERRADYVGDPTYWHDPESDHMLPDYRYPSFTELIGRWASVVWERIVSLLRGEWDR